MVLKDSDPRKQSDLLCSCLLRKKSRSKQQHRGKGLHFMCNVGIQSIFEVLPSKLRSPRTKGELSAYQRRSHGRQPILIQKDFILQVWEKYVPQEAAAANGDSHEAATSSSSGETTAVTVTDLLDANNFSVQVSLVFI